MLHYKTVSTETLGFLKFIQGNKYFDQLLLAGGTSLALQYGHRQSVDLDFFGQMDLSGEEIVEELNKIGHVQILNISKSIHAYSVNGIKIDFVNYRYPWIEQSINEDGLRLANDKDIAAMKVSAITGRGSKKDFIDLYFLLKRYSLNEILGFYSQKYPEASPYLALKSLIYFDDADTQANPFMFEQIEWQAVKANIQNHHKELMEY